MRPPACVYFHSTPRRCPMFTRLYRPTVACAAALALVAVPWCRPAPAIPPGVRRRRGHRVHAELRRRLRSHRTSLPLWRDVRRRRHPLSSLLSDGTHGPETTVGTQAGGTGGTSKIINCPAGQVVMGDNVF